MRKVWTTFIFMFSLFFLFSFSSAEVTFTFEEGKYSNYGKAYTNDYDSYLSDSASISTLEPNQISPALPDLIVPDDTVANFPYQTFIKGAYSNYAFIFTKKPLMATSSNVASYDYAINQYKGLYYESGKDYYILYTCSSTGTSWSVSGTNPASNNVYNSNSLSAIFYCNYDLFNYNTKTQVYFGSNSEDRIVMENPLSDEEIKSILEIFLESVRNADLPEHYGRYFLVYNKETGRYSGYVYPSFVDLDLRYYGYDENGRLNLVNGGFGEFYRVSVYQEDEGFFDLLADAVSSLFKKRLLYEFKSNSFNTYFHFNQTLSLDEDFVKFDTVNEPIIYTSHYIYSLIYSEDDWKFTVDESTSIDKQDFIINPETGEVLDTTINEYTEEVNSNVNLFSFIKLLFEFVFSLVSFLIRFLTFIVTFIIVPASTTILPDGFVQGIEWIHTFAFGEVLLWDIFSISFGVLLSIYIVKLIRSH